MKLIVRTHAFFSILAAFLPGLPEFMLLLSVRSMLEVAYVLVWLGSVVVDCIGIRGRGCDRPGFSSSTKLKSVSGLEGTINLTSCLDEVDEVDDAVWTEKCRLAVCPRDTDSWLVPA